MNTQKNNVVIIGASNDGALVADVIEAINKIENCFNILGFLDDNSRLQGTSVHGYRVLGNLNHKNQLPKNTKYVLALASAKKTYRVKKIVALLKLENDDFVTLVHPFAQVSRRAEIGIGVTILAGAHINSGVKIGNYSFIEGNAWLGVNTIVKDYAVITHDASVSGNTEIGNGAYVGANSSILGGVKVGDWSVIGAGAVVLKDIPSASVWVGNPARRVSEVELI